jgi:hypothetical protein
MTEPTLSPAFFSEYNEQTQSDLFSRLPAEIRYEIFANALTSAPNTALPLEQDEYCTRPGYETRHRTYTELLRTCKKAYMEAWFMPFICSEHAFWMASPERTPRKMITVEKMQEGLDMIHARHGEVQGGHIRVFPQLWALESTKDLGRVLTLKNFHPKSITITIRYTDTWFWENDEALRIDGSWGNRITLPSSVTKFCIDIESIERRKDEVDWIAGEMADKWQFKRADGTRMVAAKSDTTISRWTGSSILGERRWIRDESAPGQLQYHFATVTWRPSRESGEQGHFNRSLRVDWSRPSPPSVPWSYIQQDYLESAGIAMTVPADQVVEMCIANGYGSRRMFGSDYESDLDDDEDEDSSGDFDEDGENDGEDDGSDMDESD